MSKIPTIEVHPAYVFDCDECGAENFVRAIVPEMSQEELDELRIEHGVQPREAGQFTAFPNEVVCSECGFRYATQHMCDDPEHDAWYEAKQRGKAATARPAVPPRKEPAARTSPTRRKITIEFSIHLD